MSRKIKIKKRYPIEDILYNNLLVSLLINRVLKKGKKFLAKKIVYSALKFIELKSKLKPILILEKAIRNASPRLKLKSKRTKNSSIRVPFLISKYESTLFAIKWILESSKKRDEKTITKKLAFEILDCANMIGNTIKKKMEVYKIAESNKLISKF